MKLSETVLTLHALVSYTRLADYKSEVKKLRCERKPRKINGSETDTRSLGTTRMTSEFLREILRIRQSRAIYHFFIRFPSIVGEPRKMLINNRVKREKRNRNSFSVNVIDAALFVSLRPRANVESKVASNTFK